MNLRLRGVTLLFSALFLVSNSYGQVAADKVAPSNTQSKKLSVAGTGVAQLKDGIFSDARAADQQLIFKLYDHNNRPAAQIAVELISSFESVAKGGKTNKRAGITDKNGEFIFENVSPALRYSHRVVAKVGKAFFATDVFRMRPKGGLLARLHIYPTTDQLSETLIGSMGFIYVSQREDVLKVEALFRIINVGKNAWLPQDVSLSLPAGYHGVDVPSTEGQRFKRSPSGVELEGTYGPGQHDLSFSFLLHRKNQAHQSIPIPLLPNLADLRVMTDAIADVELSVPSFPTPELRKNPSGQGKVLFTERQMKPGEQAFERVIIDLDGLPTRGPERWIATLIAAAIALLGLSLSLLARKKFFSSAEEKETARQLLMRELLALEEAKLADEIGPRAYRQARQELLVALARLETENQSQTNVVFDK